MCPVRSVTYVSGRSDWLDEVEVIFIEPHDWMLPGSGSSLAFRRAIAPRDFEVLIRGENLIYVRM
ncbi:MAG TPA: hypothetical protein VKS60_19745 [Stellaceae bacterium]|nr:hypothetical protein [Stellaceae bacterium]